MLCQFLNFLCYCRISLLVPAQQVPDRNQMGFKIWLANQNQSLLAIAKLEFCALTAGTALYVHERWNRTALRKEVVAEKQGEVEALQEELSAQEMPHASLLQSAKVKRQNEFQAVNTENKNLRAEVQALSGFCDANGSWPRAHYEDARRRAFAYYYDRLIQDNQPATQAAAAAIGELLTGSGEEKAPASSAPEAIAFNAGLAAARRDLDAISDVDEWRSLVGQLWSQCESHIKSDLLPGWRWARPRKVGSKSGGGGGPAPQRVENPPAAPAPG